MSAMHSNESTSYIVVYTYTDIYHSLLKLGENFSWKFGWKETKVAPIQITCP